MKKAIHPSLLLSLIILSACGQSPEQEPTPIPIGAGPSAPSDPASCDYATDRSGATLESFKCSWLNQALTLQRRLDDATPLKNAWFPASHNTYNSSAYFQGASSNQDPNQSLTVAAQLSLGMMGVELDVHWAFGEPKLCHSTVNETPPMSGIFLHPFCSPTDRHVRDDLNEIATWLANNPDRVIYVDLEVNLQGEGQASHDTIITAIDETIGQYVYKPTQNIGCQAMPLTISRKTIRDAGKQVIVTGNCGVGSNWTNWIYDTSNRRQALHRDGSIPYTDYPNCASTEYDNNTSQGIKIGYADYPNFWVRMWEDTTMVGQGSGNPGAITATHLGYMARCNLNSPSLDQLVQTDARLDALVWSWAVGEPGWDNAKNCAKLDTTSRFVSEACVSTYRFACKNNSGAWSISAASGTWDQGATICASETLGSFSVPETGVDNERLKIAVSGSGTAEVWLNISDAATEGDWR